MVIGAEPPIPGASPDFGGVVARRLAGYRASLAEAGIELPDDRVVVGPATLEEGAACLARAWEDGHRTTAVLAMSDAMAIGAIGAAARHVEPPLTIVHQPIRRKGPEASRILLSAIERPEVRQPSHAILETRLIVRGSTGPAPKQHGVADGP